MNKNLSENILEEISYTISKRMGLYFPRSKWHYLEQAFGDAAVNLGFDTAEECAKWFISTPFNNKLMELMVGYFTIGETYFMRELRSYEIIEQDIIPEIIRTQECSKKRLRIWSAGCATGEEPYSIAIVLYKMRNALKDWDISILATDINQKSLNTAQKGIFTEWSFRNTPSWIKENYFTRTKDDNYEVIHQIKKMVTFTYMNLADDHYPSLLNDTNDMDIIFCRNVLMYFRPELAKKIVDRFQLCLLDGGWLFVSACETSSYIFSNFTSVNKPEVIMYRNKRKDIIKLKKSAVLINTKYKKLEIKTQENKINRPYIIQSNEAIKTLEPYEKAFEFYEKGLYERAVNKLDGILDETPNDTQALELLCRISANEGKLSKALELSERGLGIDKLNSGLHYLHAAILLERDQVDDAVKSLKYAIYLEHDFVVAHFTLGNLNLQKGNAKTSRKHFLNALSILEKLSDDDVVPEADGLTAGRFKEIIQSTMNIYL